MNKVGMAVQKSKQTRVAGTTAYKYGHPSYICNQSVSDFLSVACETRHMAVVSSTR